MSASAQGQNFLLNRLEISSELHTLCMKLELDQRADQKRLEFVVFLSLGHLIRYHVYNNTMTLSPFCVDVKLFSTLTHHQVVGKFLARRIPFHCLKFPLERTILPLRSILAAYSSDISYN